MAGMQNNVVAPYAEGSASTSARISEGWRVYRSSDSSARFVQKAVYEISCRLRGELGEVVIVRLSARPVAPAVVWGYAPMPRPVGAAEAIGSPDRPGVAVVVGGRIADDDRPCFASRLSVSCSIETNTLTPSAAPTLLQA